MREMDDFRVFYNHTIHPELMRMERLRLRLLRLLFFSSLILFALIILTFYLNITLVTLVVMIPISLYITYLAYRIQKFIQTFKPKIINLILDFIDDSLNYETLVYDPKGSIPKDQFLASKIFQTGAPVYLGEDFITGKIGSLAFELCELKVQEESQVATKLDTVFKGVFMHAKFGFPLEGTVIVWPTSQRQYLTRSMKAFTWEGGINVEEEILNEEFRDHFMTYAHEDTHVVALISEDMQSSLCNYHIATGKNIYYSCINNELYVGVTETKDILEPYLFQSNLSFELVRQFFEDINLLLRIIEDFDRTH